MLTSAVARRWTLTRDLADALEHLGVVAAVRSAGNDSGRLEDELFGVGQVVKNNPSLRDALSDPVRSVDDKAALVDDLHARLGPVVDLPSEERGFYEIEELDDVGHQARLARCDRRDLRFRHDLRSRPSRDLDARLTLQKIAQRRVSRNPALS